MSARRVIAILLITALLLSARVASADYPYDLTIQQSADLTDWQTARHFTYSTERPVYWRLRIERAGESIRVYTEASENGRNWQTVVFFFEADPVPKAFYRLLQIPLPPAASP